MIGRLLGHTKVSTTARYAHLARETEKASAARVGGSIGAHLAAASAPGGDGGRNGGAERTSGKAQA